MIFFPPRILFKFQQQHLAGNTF